MQLNYKEYGSGEPLIILHGFLGSLDNWHTLATKFGAYFRTFAIDQRNHGKSFHSETHSLQLMVDDLKEFIELNQLKNVNLLGHSMGGKVVMEFALQYPQLTNKIIVADIAPRKYKPGHDDVFSALHAVDLTKIENRKQAEEAMTPFLPDFGVRQFVLKNLDRTESGAYKWKMNLRVLYKDYEEVTKEIESNRSFDNPVLFLKGSNSLYIKETDIPKIAELFPYFKLETIENAGHWLHAEQPEKVYQLVMNFLES